MNKITLKTVDLVKFNNFVDSLIPLSDSGTIYFKLDKKGLSTDAHNESGTIVKSITLELSKLCGESNVSNLEKPIKLCFYDGNKVKKAFSFLSGNEISMEITFEEYEGELYAQVMKISSPKISINLDAADPSLFEFANVPEDAIENLKNTENSDCKFRISANEILNIKKFMDFDSNSSIKIKIADTVKICSDKVYEIDIDDSFEGISGKQKIYKVDKKLFKLLDVNTYDVYPSTENDIIVFVSIDNLTTTILTLDEEN